MTYKSIEEDREQMKEIKLQQDYDGEFERTNEILQMLRADETHLAGMLKDYYTEIERPPGDQWYEDRGTGFSRELR